MVTIRPLKEHIKTLASYSELIGLRVYDKPNDEKVYIRDSDSFNWGNSALHNLWCGKNPNDELGHCYQTDDLWYIIEDTDND